MRHYEILFLISPDQGPQAPAMIARITSIIQGEDKQGKVHYLEDIGRRLLAYPIQKANKAHYVLMSAECSQSSLKALEQAFRYNDAIFRHLIIRLDQPMSDPSPLSEEVEGKRDRRSEKSTIIEVPNYKNVRALKGFVGEAGKIAPRRVTGFSQKLQRKLATEIKRARWVSLLRYCDSHKA